VTTPDFTRAARAQAWLLLQTRVGAAGEVAASVAEVEGVSHVSVTAGAYDLVARVGVVPSDDVSAVAHGAANIPGVTRVIVCRALAAVGPG
jgi:uncharacterized protein with GYD domain